MMNYIYAIFVAVTSLYGVVSAVEKAAQSQVIKHQKIENYVRG